MYRHGMDGYGMPHGRKSAIVYTDYGLKPTQGTRYTLGEKETVITKFPTLDLNQDCEFFRVFLLGETRTS